MLREETAAITPHFDAVDYLFYIRRRWRVMAVACAVAGTVAFSASLLMPKRYTTTASILIEAPAGTDPRSFTAISPVYLESLKTYERVALSDSLFQRAMEHFKISGRTGAQSVENMKRRVLDVTKVRDTRILEISVTLENPKEAQAMAEFLATETVKLSSTAAREAGGDLRDEARRQLEEALVKLDRARDVWTKRVTDDPVETLREEINSLVELDQRFRRNIAEAQAAAAEYEVRAKAGGSGDNAKRDAEFMQQESASHLARAQELEKQVQQVRSSIRERDLLLGKRTAARDLAESQLKLAQNSFDAATKLFENVESSIGFAGDRLKVIDPGIVPQNPSQPKKALNAMLAVSVAFLGSLAYLTLAYNIQR